MKSHRILLAAAAFLVGVAVHSPRPAAAQCAPGGLPLTLANPAPSANDLFGWSVAIDGDLIAVGATQEVPVGEHSYPGAVHLFSAASGDLVASLYKPTPMTGNDLFGTALGVSGNLVVVGSSWDGASDSGSAFVFDATTGALISTLVNPVPAPTTWFGIAVGIAGNLAVVGAPNGEYYPPGNWHPGVAYVFNAATGAQLLTLNNPGATAEERAADFFGGAVAISGNNVLVGSSGDDAGGFANAGTAYVFDATTGALTATLNSPLPQVNAIFGGTVASSGNLAVIGAYYHDSPGGLTDAGAAYVFNITTGALVASLADPLPIQGGLFGQAVGISGNVVIAGGNGRVHLFDAGTGASLGTPNNPEPTYDRFGDYVAISGNRAVVGAFEASPGGLHAAGSAYAYSCDPLAPSPTPTASPTVTPSPTPTPDPGPTPCGDANGDHVIDAADAILFMLGK